VTVLGECEDWVEIQARLAKLRDFGAEPEAFGELLKPVLRYFIETFDHPESPGVRDFWSKIAHETGGSGPYQLSGWITAFCFWDEEGKSFYEGCAQPPVSLESFEGRAAGCELDGIFYHRVDTDDIPSGTASVLVRVDDNGRIYHTRMAARSAGILATSSVADAGEIEGAPLDCLQPAVGWWMIEVEEQGETSATRAVAVDGEDSDESYLTEEQFLEELAALRSTWWCALSIIYCCMCYCCLGLRPTTPQSVSGICRNVSTGQSERL
jgi:hypothetical protein